MVPTASSDDAVKLDRATNFATGQAVTSGGMCASHVAEDKPHLGSRKERQVTHTHTLACSPWDARMEKSCLRSFFVVAYTSVRQASLPPQVHAS